MIYKRSFLFESLFIYVYIDFLNSANDFYVSTFLLRIYIIKKIIEVVKRGHAF